MTRALLIAVLLASGAHAEGRFDPQFKAVTADNGTVFRVAMATIQRGDRGAVGRVVVCLDEGGGCSPPQLQPMAFDCHGHYMMEPWAAWSYAPPKSAVGAIARLVCAPPR